MAVDNKNAEPYLQRLTRAFLSLDAEKHVSTREFVEAVDAIMPVFDYLGEGNDHAILLDSCLPAGCKIDCYRNLPPRESASPPPPPPPPPC